MIRTPAIIIHELSKIYTLQFGDIIFTGTPEGVGQVTAGDEIEASIDGLETLSCSFI
jgi:2-keto-4-pentenoate hydratase/2-oxohepta-3-ene-1,7-dioic acid hydratase in catechol pathway